MKGKTMKIGKIGRIGKAVKDAWLMVGIAIVLFCLLEGIFSLAYFIKDRPILAELAVDSRIEADTYSYSDPTSSRDRTWVDDYYEEYRVSNDVEWLPYVYWRRKPYRGDHINVDADGIRLTVLTKPIRQEPRAPMKIFMFGGSALWGTGARDAFTIPSILAQELQNEGVAAQVVNCGESGYVSTQEVIMLVLLLRKGLRPDLVIFYDGINDTFSAYQQHVGGLPQNEFNRVNEFELSLPPKSRERKKMVLQDVARGISTRRFAEGLLKMTGLWREEKDECPLPFGNAVAPDGETLAQDVLDAYRGNIEIVKALGEHYRFKCLFYWQPTIFEKKNLTEYERMQREEMKAAEGFFQRTYKIVRQSGLAESREYFFNDLSLTFADVKEPVYVDWCHPGEHGNAIVAKRMARDVLGLIAADK